LLYLIAQVTFVVLFAIGHPAQAIAAVIAVQIYGIAPTLIMFRVALGFAPSEGTAAAMAEKERSIPTSSPNEHHSYPLPHNGVVVGMIRRSISGEQTLSLPRVC